MADADQSLASPREVAEFWVALRGFLRRFEQVPRRHGLTAKRYQLMVMVSGAPDGSGRATISDLGHWLQLAQSTTTGLVDGAEAAGLVRREPGELDRREVYVRLTPEGERRMLATIEELGPDRLQLAAVLAAITGATSTPRE
jgi:DNA-binding MarR family transcriptional regulator